MDPDDFPRNFVSKGNGESKHTKDMKEDSDSGRGSPENCRGSDDWREGRGDSHDSDKYPWQRLSEMSFQNIEKIIHRHVSRWVATSEECNNRDNVGNVFGLEVKDVSESEFDSFFRFMQTTGNDRKIADRKWYEGFFQNLNSDGNMDFDLSTLYTSCDPAHPFKGWPKQIKAEQEDSFNDVMNDIGKSYRQVKNLMATIYETPQESEEMELDMTNAVNVWQILNQAAKFHEHLCCFLLDPEKNESAVEDLFVEFASMANVKLLKGSAKRRMCVLGVPVTSSPDMRMINLEKETKDLLPNLNENPNLDIKTTSVVKVKRDLPRDDVDERGTSLLGTDGKVLGQLFGELLLELPHSKIKGEFHVFGILVRCTKVTFARLYMPNDMLDAIRVDHRAPPMNTPVDSCHIKFSPTYDMMNCQDRVKILCKLYRLNWTNN